MTHNASSETQSSAAQTYVGQGRDQKGVQCSVSIIAQLLPVPVFSTPRYTQPRRLLGNYDVILQVQTWHQFGMNKFDINPISRRHQFTFSQFFVTGDLKDRHLNFSLLDNDIKSCASLD